MKKYSFSNRSLAAMAMFTAPFMLLDTLFVGYKYTQTSRMTGVLDLVYVIGWIACLTVIRRLYATGRSRAGRIIIGVQIFMVLMAGVFCIYQALAPSAGTPLYYIIDTFWPLSNSFMIVTGICVIQAKVLVGWRRWIPLLMGGWFPICMAFVIIFGRNTPVMLFTGLYSATAWFLMAYALYTQTGVKQQQEYQDTSLIQPDLSV